jgi:hypothetical protein
MLIMSTMYTASSKHQNDILFFTTSGALDSSNQGRWNKTNEIHIIMAYLTHASYLLVIINLLSYKDLELLLCPFI